jgi:hypothetical protein
MPGNSRFLDLILRASDRKFKADLRARQRDLKDFAAKSKDILRSGFAAGIGGFAGFASAQGIAQFGRQVLSNEEALTRLGIQANMSAEQLAKVRAVAEQTGREFGVGTAKVIEAGNAIINLEGAAGFSAEKMRVLAQAAVATGANMSDLAGVGFALKNAFKIESAKDLSRALSAVTEAGKQGSIPLNEMSTVLQQIAVNFSKVGAAGVDGAADLAAAMQVARNSFGSASETGTGLKAFIDQLEQNSDKFRAFGVRVTKIGKDGKERLRPIREILDDIADSKIMKRNRFKTMLFGSSEARQFLEALLANRDGFNQLADAARNSNAVQVDSQKFLQSTAGRLQVAIAQAKGELEALFTPERLEKFVTLVETGLVPALDFALDHAKAIGLAIAGWKIAEASKAMLGFAGALGQGVGQAGGLMGVMGKMGASAGGILRSVVGFAGPIGLAATAAWGLFEAFSGALEKSEKITEEQMRQAEITGKMAGKISQFDPMGRVSARRALASQKRKAAEESNKLLFSSDFESEVFRQGSTVNMPLAEMQELIGLQKELVAGRGVISADKSQRIGELMRRSGMLGSFDAEVAAGADSLSAMSDAARLEAEAAAIEAVEKARFGRKDFSPIGLDLRQAAIDAGITDEGQLRLFQAQALQELSRASGGPQLAAAPEGLALRRLGVNESGRVMETTTPASLSALPGAVGAALSGNVDPGLIEAITAKLDELNANLAAAAERPISVQVDGQEIVKATANTAAQRRSPR